MAEPTHEPDAPTEDPARTVRTAADGSDSEDEEAPDFAQLAGLASRAMARQGGGGVLSGEAGSTSASDTRTSGATFIPKRGEKDFEPTGFAGQNRALEASRKAMFDVISCQRVINNKSISTATWEPTIRRAVAHIARGQAFSSVGQSRRVVLLQDGQYEDLAQARAAASSSTTPLAPRAGTTKDGVFWPKYQSRMELLPEEALYLVERGSLECRVAPDLQQGQRYDTVVHDYDDESERDNWLPMSVEQAFATFIGADGLTRPRYQLYAYLRRLGYIVQRKSVADALRAQSMSSGKPAAVGHAERVQTEGIVLDHDHPLPLVTVLDVLLYPLRRIVQLTGQGVSLVQEALLHLVEWVRGVVRRASAGRSVTKASASIQSARRSPGLLGIGTTSWKSYDEIYDRLRIVPTGHDDTLLPRKGMHSISGKDADHVPEIFFYAWRPATLFKKSEPPLPEYQLAVVDARQTGVPSAFAFADLFAPLAMPLSAQDIENLDEDEQREVKKAQEQRKRNDESYGRGAVRKRQAAEREAKAAKDAIAQGASGSRQLQRRSAIAIPAPLQELLQRLARLLTFLSAYFSHLPPGCHAPRLTARGGRNGRAQRGSTTTNVYGPLKSGRRNVIVAINDCGTSSLIRFGEAEFARWRIAGTQKQGH